MNSSQIKRSTKSVIGKIAVWKWTTFGTTAAGLALMLGLMFSTGQTNVFAKMQKALRHFDTLQFSSEIFLPDRPEAWRSSTTFMKGPDRTRDEQAIPELGNPIDIFNFSTNRYAKLSKDLNRAAVGSFSEAHEEQFRQIVDAFVGILTNADAEAADEIDRYEKEGRSYIEYRYETTINGQPLLVDVVVDTEDSFPVEIKFFGPDDVLQRKITNIVFNAPIEDSMFSTEVPEGYEVVEQDF